MSEAERSAWPSGGVHRVLGPAGPATTELAGRGWDVGVVPPATTSAELWDGLVAALRLPDWFGRNLDAFDEALRDLGRPTALVLAGWTAYATARPERWHGLLEILTDAARRTDPALVVLLTD